MEILNLLQGDRIYLDTNIWIYALEEVPEFSQSLMAIFQAIEQETITALTSELSLAEALVRPIKNSKPRDQDMYKQAIVSAGNLQVMPVDRTILIRAAHVRAETKLKLPDAIHAATALFTQCTTFLTNDKQLGAIPDITVLLLSQLNAEST